MKIIKLYKNQTDQIQRYLFDKNG